MLIIDWFHVILFCNKRIQEEVSRIKKQCEDMMQERNVAVRERNGLKQQCTAAIRQWDIALRERNEYQEALSKVISLIVKKMYIYIN